MNSIRVLLGIVATASLVACSGTYMVSADVNSYGNWPADRAAGSYAFERLPSQQQSKEQAALEDSARTAIEKAGFKPAADSKTADVLINLGARISPTERAAWDDPMWWRWRGSYGYWRQGGLYGGAFGVPWRLRADAFYDRRFEREVAVLMRDRVSNEPIYEAHASNDGVSSGDAGLVSALFSAAMSDFPNAQPESHRVSVQASR
jgi:hypothetical protein